MERAIEYVSMNRKKNSSPFLIPISIVPIISIIRESSRNNKSRSSFDSFDNTKFIVKFLRIDSSTFNAFVSIFQMIFQSIDNRSSSSDFMIFEIIIKFGGVAKWNGLSILWKNGVGNVPTTFAHLRGSYMALAGDLVSRRDNHFSFHMSTITSVSPRVR